MKWSPELSCKWRGIVMTRSQNHKDVTVPIAEITAAMQRIGVLEFEARKLRHRFDRETSKMCRDGDKLSRKQIMAILDDKQAPPSEGKRFELVPCYNCGDYPAPYGETLCAYCREPE